MDSRRVLVTASVAQACCCVPLIFTRQAVAMIALVALLGTGAAFSQATWQALIPRVAGEENIAAATALQQTAFTCSLILAPAVAGILAGAFGTGVPLALDAVTFGAMAVAALTVRTRRGGTPAHGAARAHGRRPGARCCPGARVPARAHRSARAQRSAGPERAGGWAALRRDPLLAPLIAGLAAFVLLGLMVNVVGCFSSGRLCTPAPRGTAAWRRSR